MGRHLCGAPLNIGGGSFSCLFFSTSNQNLCLTRLIDVGVDEHEKTPAVCDQKERGPSSTYFNPVLPGCGNRRMLCIFVWIWLHAYALREESNSRINQSH